MADVRMDSGGSRHRSVGWNLINKAIEQTMVLGDGPGS